jgi:predicted nucleic acid-binding protein
MRVALDTNVLAYAEGVNGDASRASAVVLLRQLPEDAAVVPVQALGELHNVLVRKSGWPRDRARAAILSWRDAFAVAPTTEFAMIAAADLAADHRLGIWDSVMISVAAEGGCRLLLSEDLQDGFSWRGVTIANPFAASRHPLLAALLGGEVAPPEPP